MQVSSDARCTRTAVSHNLSVRTDFFYLPVNLVQAFGLATDQSARNRGVMIALNDRIGSAYYTTKVSANRMDTFRAIEQGQLGIINNYTPHFFFAPARPTYWQHFDIAGISELPKVGNFYMYTDVEESDLDHFLEKEGQKGVVIAGFGAVCLESDAACPASVGAWSNEKMTDMSA